eukprot:bmy_05512T0
MEADFWGLRSNVPFVGGCFGSFHLLNKVFSQHSLQDPPQISRKHFMNSSSYYYWIGLSYSEEHHAWLWEDNSTLSQDLFLSLHPLNPKNCIIYGPSGSVLDMDCGSKCRYICKQQLI